MVEEPVGELARQAVEQVDVGAPPTIEPIYAGHYSALLCDPNLGYVLPHHLLIPVGRAWMEQSIPVPRAASPRLCF